jgi:hypothetical protein
MQVCTELNCDAKLELCSCATLPFGVNVNVCSCSYSCGGTLTLSGWSPRCCFAFPPACPQEPAARTGKRLTAAEAIPGRSRLRFG